MGDLDHNVASKLIAIKERKDQELANKDKLANSASQTETVVETPKTVEPVASETVTTPTGEVKKEAETATADPTKAAETEATKTADETEFKWDAGIVEEPKVTTPQNVDFKKLGSAFDLNANTEEEFSKQLSEKAAKLKTLEEQSDKLFEGIPTELKEAMDVAKKGGDWYTFIEHSLLDVTKLDPVSLFEQEYERQEAHKYKNTDGSIDYARLDEALDSVPEAIKVMQGKQIQNNIYLQQQAKKQQILSQTEKAKEVFSLQLGEAIKELPNHFPKDVFGITLEPQHMASIYDGISSGKLIEKHIGKLDTSSLSKADAKKLAVTIAKAEWAAGISKAQFNKGLTQAKRELLDKTQNPQLNTSSRSAEPELIGSEKPKSAADQIRERLSGGVPKGSL